MLIIVESPAKAKTISKIVGKDHTVKASVGHIRKISDTRKTDDGRKLEINGIDIDNQFTPLFEVDPDKKKVVNELKKLAKAAKDGILFATDEDREGEAISWHLAKVLGIDPEKVKRLVFHEITKSAITQALKTPRDLNADLVSAQQARQVLDKLVGYKLSPVLWRVMSNSRLSAGRVQSPALRLVVEREKEIEAFVPEEYWEMYGQFVTSEVSQVDSQTLLNTNENKSAVKKRLDSEDFLKLTSVAGKKTADLLKDQKTSQDVQTKALKDLSYQVVSVSQREETVRPKAPFITSSLQQAASSKLSFSPRQTMRLAQKLYEGIDIDGNPTALITYMRTDSTNLSAESLQAARSFITKKYPEYLPEKPRFYSSKSKNAQEAHEAIRPTDPLRTPESLKGKIPQPEWKLYDLIWRQTIACQMSDQKRQRYTFDLENSEQVLFRGSKAWTTKAGFKIIWDSMAATEEKQAHNVSFKQGDEMYLSELVSLQNFTNPPSRYSAASLIKKLEELGIGRPSTYASIISTLNDRQYVETTGSSMKPTTLGVKVSDLLADNFSQVTGSEFTARMENDLDKISRGEESYQKLLENFWWDFKKHVDETIDASSDMRSKYAKTETDVIDPKHGDKMVLRVGRFGEYYQNPNHPEVMYPKNFRELAVAEKEAHEKFDSQAEGLKCEECGKPLIVRVSKSSLNPYIACPDYRVGNKHTVKPVSYGDCPKCKAEGRSGTLTKKNSRGKPMLFCTLPKKECGYSEPMKKEG
jgi:DNA topoisomerase-1